ncbi:MAG: hypothetical protein AAB353_10335 [Candidatus Hydrogenedentota bacterium]
MRLLVGIFGVLLFCTGCPLLQNNSILIQNVSNAAGMYQHPFLITHVSLVRSGGSIAYQDLSTDPILPGQVRGFCCFSDALYDIGVKAVVILGPPPTQLEGVRTNVAISGRSTTRFEAYQVEEGGLLAITNCKTEDCVLD